MTPHLALVTRQNPPWRAWWGEVLYSGNISDENQARLFPPFSDALRPGGEIWRDFLASGLWQFESLHTNSSGPPLSLMLMWSQGHEATVFQRQPSLPPGAPGPTDSDWGPGSPRCLRELSRCWGAQPPWPNWERCSLRPQLSH